MEQSRNALLRTNKVFDCNYSSPIYIWHCNVYSTPRTTSTDRIFTLYLILGIIFNYIMQYEGNLLFHTIFVLDTRRPTWPGIQKS